MVTTKAVAYSFTTVSLIALAVFCFSRWDLSFMFTHWKGYVILGVYSIFTLSIIYATTDAFLKLYKANHGIPALGAGPDHFEIYDRHGLRISIPFEDCQRVRIKKEFRHRRLPLAFKLIISYYDKSNPSLGKTHVEIPLNELDYPQHIIADRLMKVYRNYKKQQRV